MANLEPELLQMSLRECTGDEDLLKRPRQTQDMDKYFGETASNLKRTPTKTTTCTAAKKCDGWTGLLITNKTTRRMMLTYRKGGFEYAWPEPIPMEPYLNMSEIDKYGTTIRLLCEIIGCLHGNAKDELGFTSVPAALKIFVNNKMKNDGKQPLHLHLVLFGLGDLECRGRRWTPQKDQAGVYTFLQKLVKPNTFLSVVEHMRFEVSLHQGQLVFRNSTDRSLMAFSHESFVRNLHAMASTKGGYEGWVVTFPESYFDSPPTYVDSLGKHRAKNALKVKEEVKGTYLALRAEDEDDPDRFIAWLFARDPRQWDRLRYVADVSKHPIIKGKLETKKLSILNAQDKAAYSPLFTEVGSFGLQFQVTAAGLSLNMFPLGLKIYGTKLCDSNEYGDLTVMANLDLPHWKAVHKAQKELKGILKERADDLDFLRPDYMLEPVKAPTKRARKAAPRPGPAKSPEPEESEEEEEEKSPERQDTPEKEEPKRKPLFRPRVFPKKTYKVYLHPNAFIKEADRDQFIGFIQENCSKVLDSLAPDVGIIVCHPGAVARMMSSPAYCECRELQERYPDAKIITPEQAKAQIIAAFRGA